MPKRYNRRQRVNDVVQVALAEIIQKEANDMHIGMVTVTGVEMAPDLSYARVFVSVLDDNKVKETVAALNNASKHIRYNLAQAVKLRITPELKFIYDDSTVRGSRITHLINDALKNTPEDGNEKL